MNAGLCSPSTFQGARAIVDPCRRSSPVPSKSNRSGGNGARAIRIGHVRNARTRAIICADGLQRTSHNRAIRSPARQMCPPRQWTSARTEPIEDVLTGNSTLLDGGESAGFSGGGFPLQCHRQLYPILTFPFSFGQTSAAALTGSVVACSDVAPSGVAFKAWPSPSNRCGRPLVASVDPLVPGSM